MTAGIRGSSTIHRDLEYWFRGGWHKVHLTAQSRMHGEYIELTFGNAKHPLEVINVFDYAKGESALEFGVKIDPFVDAWVAEQDRQEIEDQPDWSLRRVWLRTYVENNN